jgi:hypothetical protein
MQFLKISCTQCQHYTSCPQRTRMYVNYCGSDRKRVKEQIQMAMLECRSRRGYLFKREMILDAITVPLMKNEPLVVST